MSDREARKRGRRGSPESWSVDSHVGQRVRMRRTLLGMSQEKLGEAIGLTFQQVQKYERGSNRISAGTLFRLGQVLDVPVSFFFDAYSDPQAPISSPSPTVIHSASDGISISRRDARLLRLWRAAPPSVADEVLALLASLSPDLREGSEAQPDAVSPTVALPSVAANEAPLPSPSTRTSGAESSSGPAETYSASARRPRRRHGAVWDPADIYRAGKTGGT